MIIEKIIVIIIITYQVEKKRIKIYLGPEIKNLEEIPLWPRKNFFFLFGQKRGFSHFVLLVKHRH